MDVEEIITSLSKSLEEPYRPNSTDLKAPHGFDKALESICGNRQQRNILLDVGFQAWFAYLLADARVKAGVNGLSDSERQDVARRICNIKPDPTVEKLLHHTFYQADRARKRRSLMNAAGYRCPEPQNEVPPGRAAPGSTASLQMQDPGEAHPGISQHTQDEAEQPLPSIGYAHPADASNASPGTRPRLPPLVNSIHHGIGLPHLGRHIQDIRPLQLVDDQQSASRAPEFSSWASPSAKNIPSLFPRRMCASVVTTNRVAAIRAFFPDTVSCRIDIDIYSGRIPYIARELFGVVIEIEDECLFLKFDSGASQSFDTITLSGADRGAAEQLLGAFYKIISEDRQFGAELDEGKSVTDLISLKISGRAGNPSCLRVRGTAQTISAIAVKLWPSFPQS